MYKFPEGLTLDVVKEVIVDYPEFVCKANPELGIVSVDYMYTHEDTWSPKRPNAEILRECRGIVFDANTGKCLARPFHKFFNYKEQPETEWKNIKNMKLNYFAKLDGSMVFPIMSPKLTCGQIPHLILCTRSGRTTHADLAEEYCNEALWTFMAECIDHNITPIFEFVGPANPNVLRYDHNALRLIALRSIDTGYYLKVGDQFFDHLHRYYPNQMRDITKTYYINKPEDIPEMKDIEGFVAIDESGQFRMKIKTDEYCVMHKAKDSSSLEKNVIETIFRHKFDDLIASFIDGDRKDFLKAYNSAVMKSFGIQYWRISDFCRDNELLGQRAFAIKVMDEMPEAKGVIFDYRKQQVTMREFAEDPYADPKDKPESLDLLTIMDEYVINNCKSSSRLDRIRWLIGYHDFYQKQQETLVTDQGLDPINTGKEKGE